MTNRNNEPTTGNTIDDDSDDEHALRNGLIFIGVLAAGLTIGYAQFRNGSGGSDNLEQFGDPNPNITSLTIDDGARIRHDPFVEDDADGSSNLIDTFDHDITLPAAKVGGVFEVYDNSGKWYGINGDKLPDFDPEGDNDGLIWVNEQMASAEYEDQ